MAVIKLEAFQGEAPRVSPRLLPANGAQIARSTRLENGELAPTRKPFAVYDLPGAVEGTVKTIYKHLDDWLYWATIVNAVPGPVAQDRLYYTGDGVPKMRVGSGGGAVVYDLKLEAPVGALTAVNGGVVGAITATRLYVYTWVTDFGEESEPNPVSNALVVSPGNPVTLSGFASAPAGRNITKQRIYRSQTGTSGGTNFYFLEERAATNGNYVDTIPVDDFSEPLPSVDFNPPPDTLTGLVAMPNGIMAAYSGKDLYFCEPYQPHAWPEKYIQTTDYDITGLAVTGTTLVVSTKGKLYVASGTTPDTMVMDKLDLNLPGLNQQGMTDLGYAVVYPSHDGLVKVVDGGGASMPTGDLFTRDQWLRFNPANMVCGQFYGRFFGAYSYVDAEGATRTGTIIIDLSGQDNFVIDSPYKPDAMFYELASGSLFMVIGTTVYEWDSRNSINDNFTWRSKAFVMPAPTNFGAILFEVDQREAQQAIIEYEEEVAAIRAENAVRYASGNLLGSLNATPLNTYPVDGDALIPVPIGPTVSVNIYADGEFYATITGAGRMQRIPGGKLARQWEVEIVGNVAIQDLTMATTGQELRSI